MSKRKLFLILFPIFIVVIITLFFLYYLNAQNLLWPSKKTDLENNEPVLRELNSTEEARRLQSVNSSGKINTVSKNRNLSIIDSSGSKLELIVDENTLFFCNNRYFYSNGEKVDAFEIVLDYAKYNNTGSKTHLKLNEIDLKKHVGAKVKMNISNNRILTLIFFLEGCDIFGSNNDE